MKMNKLSEDKHDKEHCKYTVLIMNNTIHKRTTIMSNDKDCDDE
jgi:hypothetical protein